MNRQPLLSVIIPAYNAAHFLPECLLSLQNQEYNHFEVILVDDGSTDDTADLVRQNHPWVQYFWQPNSGACSSPRNTGASRAGGELLAFFDADDVMEPGCLSTHVQALSACPSAGLSLVNYQNYDGKTGHRLGPTHFETCPRLLQRDGLGQDLRNGLHRRTARQSHIVR
jgi:glycosyltransferase involved in cell wall biosynthesis